jgi:type IV pilus assembly protein PilM
MAFPFFRGRAKKREQVIAIDLGARTTKAVCLRSKADRFSLEGYAIQENSGVSEGRERDGWAEHLKKTCQALGASSKHVVLALGVADSLLRQVEMPAMPVDDMRQMLKLNPKNYLQQDLNDYLFDCCLLAPGAGANGAATGKTTPKCKVMVGGAKKQVVEAWQAAAKGAGLLPDQIVPNLVGPINTLELAQPEAFNKEVIAVIDLGFKQTTISILQNGELMLSRVVGFGGERITKSLAEVMNISDAEAEGIKVGMAQEVEASLVPVIAPLGRELRASIDYFEHQHDKTVTHVFACGGAARSECIVQALQSELMVAFHSWNPTGFMDLALSPKQMGEIEQDAAQLVVAIGAGLAGF